MSLDVRVDAMTSRRKLARAFVTALLDGDRLLAAELARRTFDLSGSRIAVFADLVHPAMTAIGELWYRGAVQSAVEHRATAIVESIAEDLPPAASASPVPRGSRCVLAALGQEEHALGLRIMAMAMQDEGWQVNLLGCGVSPEDLLSATRSARPRLVGLSAGYLPSVRTMRAAISELKESRVAVLVGGQAFIRVPLLWQRVGADATAMDVRAGVVMARRLIGA
jgi:methanogenic corrinoid protein MtbC1